MDALSFRDSVSPKIRGQELKESYAEYREYLIKLSADVLNDPYTHQWLTQTPARIEITPVRVLRLLLSDDINVENITNIEMLIDVMKTLRLGMRGMKSVDEEVTFFNCWVMFHNGASYKEIFDLTDSGKAWNEPEDTVIQLIKGWSLKYAWKSKLP